MIARNAAGNVIAVNIFPQVDYQSDPDLWHLFANTLASAAAHGLANGPTLTSITEDEIGNSGQTVASFLGNLITDRRLDIATGTLAASDVDNTPNLFLVESGPSPHGSWSIDSAGHWTYALNNGDPSVDALNNGAALPDSFTVHSTDGTAKVVSITINGATDPNVDHDTTDVNGNALVTSGPGFRSGSSHTFNGTPGADMIVGTNDAASDIINAKAGNDSIYGRAGDDLLQGMEGNDTIFGGSGNDTVEGGKGADELWGGSGNDTFRYAAAANESNTANGIDTVHDFHHGFDKIDVSAIDASGSPGDQPFVWSGIIPTANGIWFTEAGGMTNLHFDTNGITANDEITIKLSGVGLGLTASDFAL